MADTGYTRDRHRANRSDQGHTGYTRDRQVTQFPPEADKRGRQVGPRVDKSDQGLTGYTWSRQRIRECKVKGRQARPGADRSH